MGISFNPNSFARKCHAAFKTVSQDLVEAEVAASVVKINFNFTSIVDFICITYSTLFLGRLTAVARVDAAET